MSALANSTISAAVAHGSVGVSFSGAGFLIFYYIGVLEVLTKLGVLAPTSKVAGASSGAIITASQCGGLSPTQIITAGYNLAKACREQGSCSGNLDQHLRRVLQLTLPPHAWEKCRGRGYITISAGSPIGVNEPLMISDFQSQDDLIAATSVSSFIPLWSGGSLTKIFRGMQAFDGGYTLQQPCPPEVTYCIKISAKNPAWPQNRGIGSIFSLLGRIGENTGSTTSSSSTSDAARTYPQVESYSPSGQPDAQMLQLAAANNVDIAPGVFSKMPFDQQDWSDWALSPADDGTLKHMYKLGKFDAEMWAKLVGVQPTGVQQEKQQVATEQSTGKAAGSPSSWKPENTTLAKASAKAHTAQPAVTQPAATQPAVTQPTSNAAPPQLTSAGVAVTAGAVAAAKKQPTGQTLLPDQQSASGAGGGSSSSSSSSSSGTA